MSSGQAAGIPRLLPHRFQAGEDESCLPHKFASEQLQSHERAITNPQLLWDSCTGDTQDNGPLADLLGQHLDRVAHGEPAAFDHLGMHPQLDVAVE